MVAEQQTLEEQLAEMWELVHELDDVSSQLHRAAEAAIDALGLPKDRQSEASRRLPKAREER